MMALSLFPYCRRVIVVVTGMTPTGRMDFADQAVEERTFPGLELPQDGYIYQLILMKKISAGFDLAIQGDDMELIADLLKSVQ